MMFNRVAVEKLKWLLEKGHVPEKEVKLSHPKKSGTTMIDRFGRVVWKEDDEDLAENEKFEGGVDS